MRRERERERGLRRDRGLRRERRVEEGRGRGRVFFPLPDGNEFELLLRSSSLLPLLLRAIPRSNLRAHLHGVVMHVALTPQRRRNSGKQRLVGGERERERGKGEMFFFL